MIITLVMFSMRKLLITGGSGKIGTAFINEAYKQYNIRVIDKKPLDISSLASLRVEYFCGDISCYSECLAACNNIDTILHLAADSAIDSDFRNSLLDNNIIGTYNLYQAAVEQRCKRVVFASSIHAVSGYPRDVQIKTTMNVRPSSLYGVSKCFGEAVAYYFSNSLSLSSIVVRIGAYNHPSDYKTWLPKDEFDFFISPEDLHQLFFSAIEEPGIEFAIVHAISNNKYKRLDLTDTIKLLNYTPAHDGFNLK